MGLTRGLKSYTKFEAKLKDCLLCLVLDELVERTAPATEFRTGFLKVLAVFKGIYPNWQDAYAFADEYFVTNASAAEERIQQLMQQ